MSKIAKRIILGLILVPIVYAGGSCARLFAIQGDITEDGKDFAVKSCMAICRPWSLDALRRLGTPTLRESLDDAQAPRLFSMFEKLGPLVDIDRPVGRASATVNLPSQRIYAKATYTIDVEFEAHDATITFVAVLQNNEWMIHRFNVDSDLFLDLMEQT